jgi:hypothetical protein
MLWIVAATSVLVLAACLPVLAQAVSFDTDSVGAAPKGWTLTMTGRGTPKWTVERDDTAPSKGLVLKQSGTATFPLALKDGTSIKDGFVEVKFRSPALRIAPVGSYGALRMRTTTTWSGPTPLRTTSSSTRP